MKNLPLYLPALFIATTFLTLYFLYKASGKRKTVLWSSLLWLSMQAAIGLTGFYLIENTVPPRFAVLVLPPFLFVAICFFTKAGKALVDSFDTRWLTILHVVRVPVEMVLFGLFVEKYVPELMTFEGRNFDIFSGLTAPLVFYFGYVRKSLSRNVLLLWNFICVALLCNIVINAILASPVPFQQFAFDQPNIGVLYFPFLWLPCLIVPVVLFAHLVSIRQLIRQRQTTATLPLQQTTYLPSH